MAQSRIPGPVRTADGMGAARTPGPFGRNDAADPDVTWCRGGDAPGSLGTGADGAAPLASSPSEDFLVALVDEGRVIGQIRRAAFLRASLEEADRGVEAHIAAGPQGVDLRAAQIRGELLQRWVLAKQTSGATLLDFCSELAQSNEDVFEALMARHAAHRAQARQRARMIGTAGMVISGIGFGATVFRKVLGELPPVKPVGWAIDLATETAIARIDAFFGVTQPGASRRTPQQAEFEKLIGELNKLMAGQIAEHAEGAMLAKIERIHQLAEQLGPEATKLERIERELGGVLAKLDRLHRSPRHGVPSWRGRARRAAQSARRLKGMLEAQRAVLAPLQRAARVAGAGGGTALKAARWAGEHGAGRMVGAAFVANDVVEAYRRWQRELASFSGD